MKKNNKRVKQMMADVTMQGRKVFWCGEKSEIFLAPSRAKVLELFDESDEFECEQIKNGWCFMWQMCASEKAPDEPYIGRKMYDKRGKLIPHYETLPLISGYMGRADEVVQLSTSYA
ncbi:hypothetical protein [Shewanella oncorhynchi]|uniref:hypothetical protein n=1 Tax=Shewanella oncorhynchi TaxID=2726434 RepID=UPI003D7BF490